jgi:hypothetical protein
MAGRASASRSSGRIPRRYERIQNHMGWLDANDYLLMEAVARDRIDDLRDAVDVDSDPAGPEEVRVPDTPRDCRLPDTRAACWGLSTLPRPRPG